MAGAESGLGKGGSEAPGTRPPNCARGTSAVTEELLYSLQMYGDRICSTTLNIAEFKCHDDATE